MNPLRWTTDVGIAGLIDIGIMSLLIYAVLVWLNRTKRAAAILAGIVIVGLIYLFAKLFNLTLERIDPPQIVIKIAASLPNESTTDMPAQ